jgi:superfamily II DNA or RNA helicase/transcriptional regulator with XRE-family HTH domain
VAASELGTAEWIRALRRELGLTQSQLAEKLGVTFVTVSRWETGQARPNRLALKALTSLAKTIAEAASPGKAIGRLEIREPQAPYSATPATPVPDFRTESEMVRLFVEGERLRYGHLFSPSFGVETAMIDPVPHQIIAVYHHMLSQPRLRFLLADDAGAGKTIMTGLYVREMLNRRLIRRVLIVPPAGLVGNWKRELRTLFSLQFREVTGPDCRVDNPFAGIGSDLVIVSVDTLAGGKAFERLADPQTSPYDLVVFDEAHKLSATRNSDLTCETTVRYKLAELIAGAEPLQESRPPRRLPWHAHHLLLLTATPHMGKEFPYYALWRLLEPNLLGTMEAYSQFPQEAKALHFLRRTKEEMVQFDGKPIFPTRESNTVSYSLSPSERELYEEMTSYIITYYNRAKMLNRSASRLAMSVLQRRAASSTWALLRSLERRLERLDRYIAAIMAKEMTERELQDQQEELGRKVLDIENDMTSEDEAALDSQEQRDAAEEEVMAATTATNLVELQVEKLQVTRVLDLARRVNEAGQDSKFEKLRETLQDERFKGEKMLIFTEHRDTMEFLVRRLEALGYTGQVAHIHGGLAYQEREAQVEEFRNRSRFMVATDAAGEGINLQFCWIMVNYDIPWNPARIEQRFGRIHRYKQAHDPVVLVNMIADKTREGKVLKTLLGKLESIRRTPEIGDKVFDVIGRLFQGVSLSEIIMRAVIEDNADEASASLENQASPEKVKAIEEADAKLRFGGDVVTQLPTLLVERERDQFNRLLPGYVRRFVEKTAQRQGIGITGDLNGQFYLDRLPLALNLVLEEVTGGRRVPMTVNKPRDNENVLFLRPGEPFFDRYSDYFCERVSYDALRGAAFVDPYATEPYLYHLALVSIVRRADPEFPEVFGSDQTVEMRLVALNQNLGGEPKECPVELLMVLRPAGQVSPLALPSHEQLSQALVHTRSYLDEKIAHPMVERRAEQMTASISSREAFLQTGFDYQEAELLQSRAKLREKADAGDVTAKRLLEMVKKKQRGIDAQRERALAILRREPQLIEVGEINFLAHALVLPSTDPMDKERHDQEIERIAMQVARAYEEPLAVRVDDVSTPEFARLAGLEKSPGFDLLSHRTDHKRCIEVKGRRSIGDIELTENEWAKAANLRQDYWLYVVYDCATAHPRLLRVQDPFAKLLVRAKGGVLIGEASVFEAAEAEQ